jgi:hypothetical protein
MCYVQLCMANVVYVAMYFDMFYILWPAGQIGSVEFAMKYLLYFAKHGRELKQNNHPRTLYVFAHMCMWAHMHTTQVLKLNCCDRRISCVYGQCSRTCGGGTQTRTAHCVSERGWREDESDCKQSDPPVVERPCGTQDCPKWVLGEFSPVRFHLNLVFQCSISPSYVSYLKHTYPSILIYVHSDNFYAHGILLSLLFHGYIEGRMITWHSSCGSFIVKITVSPSNIECRNLGSIRTSFSPHWKTDWFSAFPVLPRLWYFF